LIPWTISEQFQDDNFGQLNGLRIVRIATHPGAQGKGYGSKAMDLLIKYYEGQLIDADAKNFTNE
jgi:N-acetyltransferase 10|tara:strand:+ start:289 stop:483 length:195 start_codon:yes stop_codon:yes gene_type:complete